MDDTLVEKANIVFSFSFPFPRNSQTAANTLQEIHTTLKSTKFSASTSFQGMTCQENQRIHCEFDFERVMEDPIDFKAKIIESMNEALLALTKNTNHGVELADGKKGKKFLKDVGKNNTSSNQKYLPSSDQEKIQNLKDRIVSLMKENNELKTQKLELEEKEGVLKQNLQRQEHEFAGSILTLTRQIDSFEASLKERNQEVKRLRQSDREENEKSLALEQEVRVLRRGLFNSYYGYGSLPAQQLMNVILQIIFDQHAATEEEAEGKICKTLKSDLSFEGGGQDKHECLIHFDECNIQIETFCDILKEILDKNENLQMFIYSMKYNDEVIVSESVHPHNKCAEILNKILKQLKSKFPTSPMLGCLPTEVLKVEERNSYHCYKQFSCYKKAVGSV